MATRFDHFAATIKSIWPDVMVDAVNNEIGGIYTTEGPKGDHIWTILMTGPEFHKDATIIEVYNGPWPSNEFVRQDPIFDVVPWVRQDMLQGWEAYDKTIRDRAAALTKNIVRRK